MVRASLVGALGAFFGGSLVVVSVDIWFGCFRFAFFISASR
jgi:hypothetical protein